MKRIKTIETRDLKKSVKTGGCGECQTSCQSACKTSNDCFIGSESFSSGKEDNDSQNGGNDHINDRGDQIHAV